MHPGQQAVFGVLLVSLVSVLSSIPKTDVNLEEVHLIATAVGTFLLLVWMICLLLALYLFQQEKKHMYIERVGINPFKNIFKVLSFAWKQKYPVNRSAFTYCEDHTPSHLDLGKK